MMSPIELIADSCARSLEMLKMTIADFSDADMLVRPAPSANHAAWQLGHMIAGEVMMINMAKPGAVPELPAGFADKYSKETSGIDDPKAFASKQQLLDLAAKTRAAAVKWIKTLTPEQLNQPGPERMRDITPTVGHLVLLLSQHVAMHIGQMQVVRRKLGRKVMF